MAGYDAEFLGNGITLSLPGFDPSLAGNVISNSRLREDIVADYINYSIITHQLRRSPILAALNIDQNLRKRAESSSNWRIDSRIGAEFQLNNDYYHRNPWDRGHLARRASTAWGQTRRQAQKASDETYYYSNATLQHEKL